MSATVGTVIVLLSAAWALAAFFAGFWAGRWEELRSRTSRERDEAAGHVTFSMRDATDGAKVGCTVPHAWIDDYLDQSGLIAVPKAADFRPERRP